MNAADLAARVRRLDQLSRGIALEISIASKANDPLLYLERQAYLANLRGMLGGVEAARVVLVKARHRLDGETGRRAGTGGKNLDRTDHNRGGLDGSAQRQGTMPSARPIRSGVRMAVRNLISYSTLRFAK
jgi:hypothetical protein